MNSRQEDVTAFHKAMGHPAPTHPVFEITGTVRNQLIARARWLHEEADELEEAAMKGDLVGALDALADSEYFAVGGYVVLGQNGQAIWDNVQISNMAKLGPDGKPVPHPDDPEKIGKPEGWIAPEERHRGTLEAAKLESDITGLALQIAFSLVTNPEGTIDLPVASADFLAQAMERALLLTKLGADQVIYDYKEMANEVNARA